MSENTSEQNEKSQTIDEGANPPRRWLLSRRKLLLVLASFAVPAMIVAILAVALYRYGAYDSYIKSQFVEKLNYMGLDFSADVFRVTASPLELELKNATFNNRKTGEKLFFVRQARIGLTIENLFAWQLTRDIKVDSTEIYGAEAWIRFDENGRSNFKELVSDDRYSRLNFKYSSINFALRDSVVHFGDLSRNISADANELQVFLSPVDANIPDEQKRYKIEITSTKSSLAYGDGRLDNVTIAAHAIADPGGADISELTVETPIGRSVLRGRVSDWSSLKYDLDIESTVDLTQASSIFPLGAVLRGVGNFKGKVSGAGENYKIDGQANSDALSAEGIYLKGFNVAATVRGTDANYEANGNAVAEMLTFDDFRIDFPKMAGNVRGTGSDFRWVGELQAIAMRSKSLSIVGLFLSDAVAEYKDRQLETTTGNGRAQKFSLADTEFADLRGRGIRFSREDGVTEISSPDATAGSMKTPDYRLDDLKGRNLKVRDSENGTSVTMDALSAKSARLKNNVASGLRADKFALKDTSNGTRVTLEGIQAERVTSGGTVITGTTAPSVTIDDDPVKTIVYADRLRVASIAGGGAVLGNLNIAGVRLTIRQGTVEGTSEDIDAGDVAINKTDVIKDGGKLEAVKIMSPVFIVEPSGRYRASADMSIGGGTLGSIPLGRATASVNVDDHKVELKEINASVMDGKVNGYASIAYGQKDRSQIVADFDKLDLSKIVALQGGRVIPFEGRTTGRAEVTFNGTDVRSASGTIIADVAASAGNAEHGTIPVNGRVELTADNGMFNVDLARLSSAQTELTATGRFDLRNDDSKLGIVLNSSDAGEVDRLVRALALAPELEQQLDAMDASFAGSLKFDAQLTGNLADPAINGRASLNKLLLHGREIGSVTSDILISGSGTEFRDGSLKESGGGTVAFSVSIPAVGMNNTSVQATLTNVNAASLIAALPVDLPEQLRDFTGSTSGSVDLSGLPNAANGSIDIASSSGSISGQSFDALTAKAVFSGTKIDLERLDIRAGDGSVTANGTFDRDTTAFDIGIEAKKVPLPLALSFLPKSDSLPTFSGVTDLTARAQGIYDRPSTFNINFNGKASDVVINDNNFGTVEFKGITANGTLNADLTAILNSRPQIVTATVDFSDTSLPFHVEHVFDETQLAPLFALLPQLKGIDLGGIGSGRIDFGGNLLRAGANGQKEWTAAGLTGTARFSRLDLQIQDTPLSAQQPVVIRFSPQEIEFESARMAGGGSNVTVSGKKALTAEGMNNLAIDGRINLALLNVLPQHIASDAFFGGFADVAVNISGPNSTARLSGTANLQNAAFAIFVGSSRLSFDRLVGRILFTSNQAQIESATGFLGGGKFTASGGVLFRDNLSVDSFRVALDGANVTVPLPQDFITTGDAKIEFTGRRFDDNLFVQIAGNIRARRSIYSRDIELSNVIGARREGSLSTGPSSVLAPRFDLTIEGRDALIVKNNIADLTASVSLRLTGTTDNPQLSGRISANSGTLFFRKDRYVVQRGVLEFPPDTAIEPVISLQAETEIKGYQVFVNLSGPLNDAEALNASVRSSPALPSQDVISLITTGSLSNTEGGLPTFAQTGINTAAEVLTDSIINAPARKATDKLFGLNVFEIDPIITGERLNPSARLTVGRQINNNLRVTYATNLSQDQNQVLALEYRLSNKLSVVAQYEQRSLSNVTRNRDNFSVEVRFRRRF